MKKTISETQGTMVTAATARTTYWTGPAAKLFGGIFDAYVAFINDTATRTDEYAKATQDVADHHKTAQTGWWTVINTMRANWKTLNDTLGKDMASSASTMDGRMTDYQRKNEQAKYDGIE